VSHTGPVFKFGGRTYDLGARTHIMGIVNVTPDSFSDGGLFSDPSRAVERALEMVSDGADFIDVGGESTRPRGSAYGDGAADVSADEELARVLPVIRELAKRSPVPVSVDTTKSDVARAALEERRGQWRLALDLVKQHLAKHPASVEALQRAADFADKRNQPQISATARYQMGMLMQRMPLAPESSPTATSP